MQKVYRAKSHVSLNITLPNGKSTHVSFEALTGGGSIYVTENAMIQQGFEGHPKFGRMFKLVGVSNVERSPVKSETNALPSEARLPVASRNTETPTTPQPVQSNEKVVDVASLDDAKAYLVDNFGISRTKLRSKKQIEEAAAANGVVFNFI